MFVSRVLYRLCGLATGFLVVVAIALLGRSVGQVPPRVLPEQAGAIRVVEIQFTRRTAEDTWPVLRAFFDRLGRNVEVIAACGDAQDAAGLKRLWTWHHPLRTVVVGAQITGWSKDRFLVASGRPTRLVRPRADPDAPETRSHDPLVPEAIAAQVPGRFSVVSSDLAFDAGDIVCTTTQAIFSDSLWRKNGRSNDLSRQVSRLTALRPVWLKGVPDHHIGMFAAPLGEGVVAVGDPDLGRRLWTQKAGEVLGKPDYSDVATQPFREAAQQFRRAGFRVVRVPECILGPQVYTTYTNGVFETIGGKRVVYMPAYGIPAMDDAASKAYQGEGWEVRPIPVRSVFRYRGTIGCLVNVLERSR